MLTIQLVAPMLMLTIQLVAPIIQQAMQTCLMRRRHADEESDAPPSHCFQKLKPLVPATNCELGLLRFAEFCLGCTTIPDEALFTNAWLRAESVT